MIGRRTDDYHLLSPQDSALMCRVGGTRSSAMHPSDDSFYARLFILSDAELCHYIHHYADYKAEAVYAALAELRTRDVYVSDDVVSAIERYFTRQEQRLRPFNVEPRHLRLLAYVIGVLGIGLAVFIYATA